MTLTLQQFYILSILAQVPEAQLRTEDFIEELNAIGNVPFKFSTLSVKNSITSLEKEGMIYIDYAFNDDIPDSEIRYAAISDEGIDLVKSYSQSLMDGETGWKQFDLGNLLRNVYLFHGREIDLDYIYPKITPKFHSPLLNWDNLLAVGGYFYLPTSEIKNKFILSQVILGKKPMGFVTCNNKEDITKLEKIASQNGLGFFTKDESEHFKRPQWDVGFCIKGTFGSVFNIDALIEDYKAHFRICKPRSSVDFGKIAGLKDKKIEDFLGFNYSDNNKSIEDDIITGLLLGYPVESTVAVIANI